jgi:hypothetical protein
MPESCGSVRDDFRFVCALGFLVSLVRWRRLAGRAGVALIALIPLIAFVADLSGLALIAGVALIALHALAAGIAGRTRWARHRHGDGRCRHRHHGRLLLAGGDGNGKQQDRYLDAALHGVDSSILARGYGWIRGDEDRMSDIATDRGSVSRNVDAWRTFVLCDYPHTWLR